MKRSIGLRAQPGLDDVGDGGPPGWDERPVRLARGHSRLLVGDPLGPLVDPVFEQVDLGLGQAAAGSGACARLASSLAHGRDERALVAAAGNHGRPGLAPLERRRGRIEPQPASRLGRAVTRHAMPRQDRLDLTGVIDRRTHALRPDLWWQGGDRRQRKAGRGPPLAHSNVQIAHVRETSAMFTRKIGEIARPCGAAGRPRSRPSDRHHTSNRRPDASGFRATPAHTAVCRWHSASGRRAVIPSQHTPASRSR